jgi:hypothetical protein
MGTGGATMSAPWDAARPGGGPRGCVLYLPGHQTHYIQARKARERHGRGRPCEVTALIAPDTLIVSSGKVQWRRHHHDLDNLAAALDRRRPEVRIYPATNLLMVDSRCFSIATTDAWNPNCRTDPLTGGCQ